MLLDASVSQASCKTSPSHCSVLVSDYVCQSPCILAHIFYIVFIYLYILYTPESPSCNQPSLTQAPAALHTPEPQHISRIQSEGRLHLPYSFRMEIAHAMLGVSHNLFPPMGRHMHMHILRDPVCNTQHAAHVYSMPVGFIMNIAATSVAPT